MTLDDLRSRYLKFFESWEHVVIPSSPLVPENDPTTLFTSSGMQPLVPYLLGQSHPLGSRLTNCQKSFRTQDIEEVGDNRHTTFFEMLGNWSLGNYFKQEQLAWIFEFLTKEIGLKPERLFVTVFAGNIDVPRDEEAIKIWQSLFKKAGMEAVVVDSSERGGIQGGRIFPYDDKRNWWSRSGAPEFMPVGEPGGPDSEIFFDFGSERRIHETSAYKDHPCHVNCNCGRFMEIGNSVFMQFQKQDNGGFKELPQKNVDFGGGLERILAALADDPDVFKTDAFGPIIAQLERLSGKKYAEDTVTTRSFRVIADHIKAATMLGSDGVFPGNKAQGYFVRRLVRRAIRYGQMIGITKDFLPAIISAVVEMYAPAYPNVRKEKDKITEALTIEETKFRHTLDRGLKEIEKIPLLTGETAFSLYETYGFPLELTQEIAHERGQIISKLEFEAQFNKHKDASRTASSGMFKGGLVNQSAVTTKYHTTTHLLQAALRQTLGNHVEQRGSNITAERLRFDFSHPQALTEAERNKVEQQINAWIEADLPVTKQTMRKQAALDSGAIAFFVEKYPEEVSVYTIGKDPQKDWISKELCGGPHVARTGEIGKIKITKEQSVSAGTRRIYLELAS